MKRYHATPSDMMNLILENNEYNKPEGWPSGTYSVIYADPPWSYYNDSNLYLPKTVKNGSMRYPPYPVMASSEIKSLPVAELARENCILFIWTTDYHLSRCCEVISAWGFTYKTVGFVWQKLNKNGNTVCFMGAYTMKSGVELCLLATKGKDAHKMVCNHKVKSLVVSDRKKHSEKPAEIRDRIVQLTGEIPRIELFAREKVQGWESWGNELYSSIDSKEKSQT